MLMMIVHVIVKHCYYYDQESTRIENVLYGFCFILFYLVSCYNGRGKW